MPEGILFLFRAVDEDYRPAIDTLAIGLRMARREIREKDKYIAELILEFKDQDARSREAINTLIAANADLFKKSQEQMDRMLDMLSKKL